MINFSHIKQTTFSLIAATSLTMTCLFMGPASVLAASFADIIFVVDESGSMSTEHAFLGDVAPDLEAALMAAGVGDGTDASDFNQFGLVGFGGNSGHGILGHMHTVGGGSYGTAAQFVTATGGLITSGGTEDGYDGIDTALNDYTFRAGAAVNIILVTDEDRDVYNGLITQSSVLTDLLANGAQLNVIVKNPFSDYLGDPALGLSGTATNTVVDSFVADGAGGFIKTAGGTVGNGSGSTETDYVPLAFNTNGAAWDLNKLRAGGLVAESFSAAFIDVKVEEIVNQQPVPEPSTIILLGSGLVGLVAWRRKKQA